MNRKWKLTIKPNGMPGTLSFKLCVRKGMVTRENVLEVKNFGRLYKF